MKGTGTAEDAVVDDTARLLVEAARRHGTSARALLRGMPDEVLESIFRRVRVSAEPGGPPPAAPPL
ncbi:hypothetical protein [Actinomadura macrotermitis]|uniref:Uncharacterized protein n=1 Tax=Actinomadura macrotermitis TaxID=2585200 RepID=A0A7K0C5B4_9ACTN|nr:hypothetical protein [Actinomadura macrotermitis]MQY08024.1 hypothetical protein [Actinomadura macrotermitis]